MSEENITRPSGDVQNSRHIWITIIAVVLTAIIVGGGVYAWQKSNLKSIEQSLQQQITDLQNQITNLQESSQFIVTSPEEKEEGAQSKGKDDIWSLYKNDTHKIEFKYNPKWSIAPINSGSGYDATHPFILIWSGETSNEPCQDLGCPPKLGDKDVLTKGDTFEGAPPLNPWFKILRVRGNKWVSIQVTDVTKNCQTEESCQQYIEQAPLEQKIQTSKTGYQAYNDFIELISTLKFNE